jgi:hypothetical protein
MRSSEPIPNNPWPHDMVITVESHDHRLCELLWARDVYRIPGSSQAEPPPIWPEPVMPPEHLPPVSVRRGWGPLWMQLWREVVDWYAMGDTPVDPGLQALASDPAVGLEQVQQAAAPRSWSDAVGEEYFDRLAFAHWEEAAVELLFSAHRAGEPEQDALPALVEAWRRGLNRVIELPALGEYTRTLGASSLMVTAATRADPDAYALALTSFRLAA